MKNIKFLNIKYNTTQILNAIFCCICICSFLACKKTKNEINEIDTVNKYEYKLYQHLQYVDVNGVRNETIREVIDVPHITITVWKDSVLYNNSIYRKPTDSSNLNLFINGRKFISFIHEYDTISISSLQGMSIQITDIYYGERIK